MRVDTLVRIDTLVSPPVHDTTFVLHVDTLTRLVHDTTIVQRTDTLFLPGAIVHDTTWVYVQQQPTNPVGGGDPRAGLAWIDLPGGFGYALVFWHGNFVGVTDRNDLGAGESWDAWLYTPPGGAMRWRGRFATKLEAIQALVPISITIGP